MSLICIVDVSNQVIVNVSSLPSGCKELQVWRPLEDPALKDLEEVHRAFFVPDGRPTAGVFNYLLHAF